VVASPASLAIGANTVTWTVTDGSGNTATSTQTVTVTDTQNPTIICAPTADSYPYKIPGKELDPTVIDNCGVASVINDYNNSASLQDAEFPLGTTVVTWTVIDGSGNMATCINTVVINDIQPPTISCATVPVVSYEADQGSCTYKISGTTLDPTITDNDEGATVSNNFNNSATLKDAQFPIGETTVLWTVTDRSGNTASCIQTIRVNDTQFPTIVCPANINVAVDVVKCTASGLVLGSPIVDDNCSVATISNNAPDIFPLGPTIVTWTVTDSSGNMVTCNQTVTVNGLPVAVDDFLSVDEDAEISGNVMANDYGMCDIPVLVKSHTEPSHGALTLASDGVYTYTPDDNYHGTDLFTYQICDLNGDCSTATVTITINSVNDLPVANDDVANVNVDGSLSDFVDENDLWSGDGGNEYTLVTPPSNGSVFLNPDGSYTYTPNISFIGTDSFTYKLCDSDGDCDDAKVTIDVEDILLVNQILTPNGDGINDRFTIKGIELYPNNKVTLFNRWGNVVYEKIGYKDEWDGNSNSSKIGSKSLPSGTYYFIIDYGSNRHKTGFVQLDK
jgi:gliding motility-associated-like protein